MTDYSQLVPISTIDSLNVGLHSATEPDMISALGRPLMPLTTQCRDERASDAVRHLMVTQSVGPFRVTGIKPAVASLAAIFAQVKADKPDLYGVLGTAGMICVRLRKPTSGAASTKISNHAWGTAIDVTIGGHDPQGNTGQNVPLGIALLVPYFNRAGWYSGISFHDDMHFEVASETIHKWQIDGSLKSHG